MSGSRDYTSREKAEVISTYYKPEQKVGEISQGEREFSLVLLDDLGFRCIAGAVGTSDSNVSELSKEIAQDSIRVSNSDDGSELVTGPNPILVNGVGMWAEDR